MAAKQYTLCFDDPLFTPLPQTRKQAIKLGSRYFWTSKPCRYGHISARRSDTGTCKSCINKRNRERMRADYKINPDKHISTTVAYQKRNPETVKETNRRSKEKRRDKVREERKKWYEKNRDYVLKNAAEYAAKNSRKIKSRMKRWRAENAGRLRNYYAKSRAAKINATPPWADLDAIQDVYEQAQRQQMTDGIVRHVDHIIPLRNRLVCGLHVHENLQILTAGENLRKYNRFTP